MGKVFLQSIDFLEHEIKHVLNHRIMLELLGWARANPPGRQRIKLIRTPIFLTRRHGHDKRIGLFERTAILRDEDMTSCLIKIDAVRRWATRTTHRGDVHVGIIIEVSVQIFDEYVRCCIHLSLLKSS